MTASAPREQTHRQLQRLLDRLVARRSVPHAVVAVDGGPAALSWAGAAGTARPDGSAMTTQTPYFIASVDKLFVAALVWQLHEQQRVDVARPIGEYLSVELIERLHVLDGVDRTGDITLLHLLSHTSGLADYLEDRPNGGQSLVEELLADGDRAFGIDEATTRVRDRLTPHFPPQPQADRRPKIRYCDTNYQLLIAVIEAVTGDRLHHVLDERLLTPLHLDRTYQPGYSRPRVEGPPPATLWAGDRPLDLPLAIRSFPGIYSTVGDQVTFLRALLGGAVFDNPTTLAMMCGRWVRFGLPLDRAALRAPSWPIEYGRGAMRFALPRWLSPTAPTPPLVGHSGSTGSWLFAAPELDLYLAGTVDQVTAGAVPFRFLPKVLRAVRHAQPG